MLDYYDEGGAIPWTARDLSPLFFPKLAEGSAHSFPGCSEGMIPVSAFRWLELGPFLVFVILVVSLWFSAGN